MAETFKVGDKVQTDRPSMPKGTIVFGPYMSAGNGAKWCLVQAPDGQAVSVPLESLTHAPSYTIGETAEERAMGRMVTIEAGPFKGAAGQDRYVVKVNSNGVHSWVAESGLRKRQAPPASPFGSFVGSLPPTFVYRSRTYYLEGEYADRQGDVWKFNGRTSSDGTPSMDCALYPAFSGTSLSDLVSTYGPLSRA